MKRTRILGLFGIILFLAALMTGCGGGSKDGGDTVGADPDATTTLTLQIELRDGSANRISRLTVGQTVYAYAKVQQIVTAQGPNGPYTSTRDAPGVQVVFQTPGGTLTPMNGSVLSDQNGRAQATFVAGNTAGAFQLTASATAHNATGATTSFGYSIDRTLVGGLAIDVLDQSGTPRSTLRAGDVYTIRVTATHVIEDITNPGAPGTPEPVPDLEVTVASDGGTFDPTSGKAVTDEAGVASVQFQAALENGVFQMAATATIDDNETTNSVTYTVQIPVLRIGSGNPFQNGVLQLEPPEIDSTGASAVTAVVVDENDQPFLTPVEVEFSSPCAGGGAADLQTPSRTVEGVARTTYRARGCGGSDEIRARLLLEGQTVPATANARLIIRPAEAVGLEFVENSSDVIATRGNGNDTIRETADVTFRAIDIAGNPVVGAVLSFSLTSETGGITLTPTPVTTGPDGKATTTVRAGFAAAVVRVVATNAATAATAQSAPITISNGRPVHGGISMSFGALNVEAFQVDGVANPVAIRLVDRDGTPVPDGTNVRLSSEGGSIPATCTTSSGVCSIALTSQAPRPSNGRVSVLAATIGDERFSDQNGDGQYQGNEGFVDSTEAWRDDNENTRFDVGEPFLDDNRNGMWDGPNGRYDGAACVSGCGSPSAPVFARGAVVFSTSAARISIFPNPIDVHPGETRAFTVAVSDLNGNMMAAGTSIEMTATGAELETEEYTISDTNSPGPYIARATVTGAETTGNGSLTVTVRSPGGTVSTGFATIRNTAPEQSATKDNIARAMFLNPSTVRVPPMASKVAKVLLTLDTGTPGQFPVAGIVPYVTCEDASDWIAMELAKPSSASNTDGLTTVSLQIRAGSRVGMVAQCTVRAGEAVGAVTAIVGDGT